MHRPFFLFAALPLLAGCSLYEGGDGGRMCTMEYRSENVRVLDAAGVPVEDAAVNVLRVSTGRSVVCTAETERGCLRPSMWPRPGFEGRYAVMDDGVAVARRGEDFRVVATRGASRAEAVLRFAHDGCHIQKRAGPDVLTLAP